MTSIWFHQGTTAETIEGHTEVAPDQLIRTALPHSCFGDSECCGCLNGLIRGDHADIVCKECEAVVRTVSAGELQRPLTEMELTLDVSKAVCPHCGAMNLFPGLSMIVAFTCKQCGEVVKISDANVDRFFG